jgi:hypothetical protein
MWDNNGHSSNMVGERPKAPEICSHEFYMNDDSRQDRTLDDGTCTYCGGQMAASSPICFACGMPRFKMDSGAGAGAAIPPPKPIVPQKAYVPEAQHYAAIPDVPYETVAPPTLGQPPAEESPTGLASVSRETWTRIFRSAAAVIIIAVLAYAVVFGVGKAWQARNDVHVDLKEVRTKLDDIRREYVTPSHENSIPHYTATVKSRSNVVKRVSVAQPAQAKSAAAMQVRAVQTSSAPIGCGPGVLQVQIAPTSPAPAAAPATPRN